MGREEMIFLGPKARGRAKEQILQTVAGKQSLLSYKRISDPVKVEGYDGNEVIE